MARGSSFSNKDTSAVFVVTKLDGEVIAGPYFMQGTAKAQANKYLEKIARDTYYEEQKANGVIGCTYSDFWYLPKEERKRRIKNEKDNVQIRIYTYSGFDVEYV